MSNTKTHEALKDTSDIKLNASLDKESIFISNEKSNNNNIEIKPLKFNITNTNQKSINNINCSNNKNTLNEPILETIKKDLILILIKIYFVLNPFLNRKNIEIKIIQWDLWGPLFISILFSINISFQTKTNIIVLVLTLFWVGAFFVYLSAKMIGCKYSVFNFWCLLGYSLFSFLFFSFILIFLHNHWSIKITFGLISWFWSCFICYKFFITKIEKNKIFIILYPIILFFGFFFCILILN